MWRSEFSAAAQQGVMVAVCNRHGHIVAAANIGGHVIVPTEELMGDRWFEYVEDADRVRSWFGRSDESEPIVYVQLGQHERHPCLHLIALVKRRVADVWFCYGAVRPMPDPQPFPLPQPQQDAC